MPTNPDAVDRYYGQTNVSARILAALQGAGKDIDHLTRDDLAIFDELHNGGLEATRTLARLGGLRTGMRVLDVGSGLGGPARTLAAEFGCQVVGMDLTTAFCEAAQMLTARLDMSDHVTFRQGDALAMPFDDDSFDVVWTQNVLMNIEDKRRLFREMRRVLRPGGRAMLQAVMAGPVPGVHYPVPWASDPGMSFLEPPAQVRQWLLDSGLSEVVWEDVSPRLLALQPQSHLAPVPGAQPLVSNMFSTVDPAEIMANQARNREEGHIVTGTAYSNAPCKVPWSYAVGRRMVVPEGWWQNQCAGHGAMRRKRGERQQEHQSKCQRREKHQSSHLSPLSATSRARRLSDGPFCISRYSNLT